MGQCLPGLQKGRKGLATVPAGTTCIDLSNNDPIYGVAAWRAIRSRGIRCAYFKVNEGTGFVDRTAAAMARDAKAAGLLVGGYDFQHVCSGSGASEAHVFAAYLRADGLLGLNVLQPAADAEYPFGALWCNGRAWEVDWRSQLWRETGRSAITYTGAWWWNPHLGAWWPGGYSWISGYGVSWPFMPGGLSHLDMWQWSDRGFNGVSSADIEVWLGGDSAFRVFANQAPLPPPLPLCFMHRIRAAQCSNIRTQIASWKRAKASSQRAYAARGCPGIVRRRDWFHSHLSKPPKSRHAYRESALKASNRAYRRQACAVFASREGLFESLIRQAKARN